MTPTRIQRSRKADYPAGRVLTVTRPGNHGNPYVVEKIDGEWRVWRHKGLLLGTFTTKLAATEKAVEKFRMYLSAQRKLYPEMYAVRIKAVRAADFVACWCAIGSPCHGDVWIELAEEKL